MNPTTSLASTLACLDQATHLDQATLAQAARPEGRTHTRTSGPGLKFSKGVTLTCSARVSPQVSLDIDGKCRH